MTRQSKNRLFVAIIMTLLAFSIISPYISKNHFSPTNAKINLGLDLQGGSHLLLNVNFKDYINNLLKSNRSHLKNKLKQNEIKYSKLYIEDNKIILSLKNIDDISQNEIKNLISSIDDRFSVLFQDNNLLQIYFDEYAINIIQDKILDQSIEIIRKRIDKDGTKEPIITRQGVSNVLLQVPGENNPSILKQRLGKTAKLSFHLVKSPNTNIDNKDLIKVHFDDNNNFLYLDKNPIVTGENLTSSKQSLDSNQRPAVAFTFNNIGAEKFGEFTAKYQGERIAIVLDNKILSAPVVNQPILGGSGIINGNFTIESAIELSLLLSAGALPASLDITEERTIGPSLGIDAINSGKTAAFIGFVLVVIFMILTYSRIGIIAAISLILTLIYILALLSIIEATLTLPGIAGIILTIGMAVDANVLIYERIKEEKHKKTSNEYAIKSGFNHAFNTIFDSNITTLIAAFLLYSFGVGAIKGFAITLTIGIIASMYTSLIINRLLIEIWVKYCKPTSIIN